MESSEPVRRAAEIEDVTNLYFVHPISNRIASLSARGGVSANMVSFAGMLFGVAAGLSYLRYTETAYAVLGFVLMLAWHIMDGADGQVARLTQTQSETGKVIDGICDYATFLAVYLAFGWTLSRTAGGWAWAVVIGAGVCHALQAAAYEVQRQEYNFWGLGHASAALPDPDDARVRDTDTRFGRRLLASLYRFYVQMQWQVGGVTREVHGEMAAAMRSHPGQREVVRRKYRDSFSSSVRWWSVLSSNYRTLGIFIAALLVHPLWYFWFEIIGFNLIMAILIVKRHILYDRFVQDL